jgi:hypothetical protein
VGNRSLIVGASLVLVIGAVAALAVAGEIEFSGFIAGDLRFFPQSSPHPEQSGAALNPSLVVQPELRYEWNESRNRITLIPFARLDSLDTERTHVDLREFNWLHVGEEWGQRLGVDWELRLGIDKVFWGVTESVHLVDIINQTDLVENPDGEDKLGQPMVNLTLVLPWRTGTLDLFLLPYFRERTFPGEQGRLRPPVPIDTDRAEFESGAEEHHIDWAVRWSHTLGDFDIGVSHFSGTSREPRLIPRRLSPIETVLVPFYDLIDQTGLDLQWTKGGWLWKLEIISREGQGDRFTALAGGFEYTFVGVFNTAIDVGLLAEYLYDDRDDEIAIATAPFEDDVFMGTRFTFNDAQSTELLAGVIFDTDSDTTLWFLEGSRRLGENWTLDLEVRAFNGITSDDPLFGFQKDDFLQLTLSRHF